MESDKVPSVNFSLTDDLKAFVDQQGRSPFYAGNSDYIRHLLREDQRRVEQRKRLEEKKNQFAAMVQMGLDSPDSGLSPDELRAKTMARVADHYE